MCFSFRELNRNNEKLRHRGVKTLGIINRIKLNVRANVNHMLDKAENPQKVFDQFLIEMQDSVKTVKQAVADAIVGVKKLERKISETSEAAEVWRKRAVLALKNDDEELARSALHQEQAFLEKERRSKEELEKQKRTVEELKQVLADLSKKLEDLHQKKIEVIKRDVREQHAPRQAPSTGVVPYQIYLDMSAFDAYDRMVDKVETMEAQAEALAELSETDDVDREFQKLERDSKVESELKAMKDELRT